MPVEKTVVGQLQTNCYFFYKEENKDCLLIDPGDDAGYIMNQLGELGLKPRAILATHGHFDHLLAATELKLAYRVPFYLSQKDIKILKRQQRTAKFFTGLKADPPPPVDRFLKEGQKLEVNGLVFVVITTPGHTPGSVSFYCQGEGLIFSGDLIFLGGGRGRTDLEGSNPGELKNSIKKILSLPAATIIYPGHGRPTTVKKERKYWPELLK